MEFGAPWGITVKLVTMLVTILLIVIPIIGLTANSAGGGIWFFIMLAAPIFILIGAAIFMIRGYELSGDQLFIRRLGWRTVLSLKDLRSAESDPQAMSRSFRLFGNHGLFCFAGLFTNKKLGRYRAYATDPSLAVVMRFPDKVVVVTPDRPDRFVAHVNCKK